MRRDAPDTRFYQEISGLNREFLALLTHPDAGSEEVHQLGLPTGVAEVVTNLSSAELDFVANVPVLLADLPDWVPPGVAEPIETGLAPRWVAAAQGFSASLLTYVWQLATRDRLATALCLGPIAVHRTLSQLSFADIQRAAVCDVTRVRARQAAHPRLWEDLLRAARSDDRVRRHQCRLDWIPLGLAELRDSQSLAARHW